MYIIYTNTPIGNRSADDYIRELSVFHESTLTAAADHRNPGVAPHSSPMMNTPVQSVAAVATVTIRLAFSATALHANPMLPHVVGAAKSRMASSPFSCRRCDTQVVCSAVPARPRAVRQPVGLRAPPARRKRRTGPSGGAQACPATQCRFSPAARQQKTRASARVFMAES